MLNINTNTEIHTEAQTHTIMPTCTYAFMHRCRHQSRQLGMHALSPLLSLPLRVSVSPSLFFSSYSERKQIPVPCRIHDCMDLTMIQRCFSDFPRCHTNIRTHAPAPDDGQGAAVRRGECQRWCHQALSAGAGRGASGGTHGQGLPGHGGPLRPQPPPQHPHWVSSGPPCGGGGKVSKYAS